MASRDETYVVAGHKGQPEKVAAAGRPPRRRRLKGARGRGTRAAEKPPIFGMIQRSSEVVIRMLDSVRQATIKPLILRTIALGTEVHTDEHSIYSRLPEWGYGHRTVNHSAGEYARDEDGDGFHEVHVNTMEDFWSLLRSWLRPHRGISQAKFRCTWASSSSSTTPSGAANACCPHCWRVCSRRLAGC